MTDSALAAFLEPLLPDAEELVVRGPYRLRLAAYVTPARPPAALVTSVRGVVLRGDAVLVVRDPDGEHILPGGRIEPGETWEAALRRAVEEETGRQLGAALRYLGCKHYRHLTPRPLNYRHPYPDFVQVVFAAEAPALLPEQRTTGSEPGGEFRPIPLLPPLPPNEQQFLAAARRSAT